MVMLCKSLNSDKLELYAKVAQNKIAEVKEDGDRMRMIVKNKEITLLNRTGKDVTFRYPKFTTIDLPDTTVDGEICVVNDRGISVFNDGIAHRTHLKDPALIKSAVKVYPVIFIAFDLLELENTNYRHRPFKERRDVLETIDIELHKNIQLVTQSKDIMGLWKYVTELGGEGIVIKDLNEFYYEGKRKDAWTKVKDVNETDLYFNGYEVQPRGITLTNNDEIRVVVNGEQSKEVRNIIDDNGIVHVTIRHLGEKTKNDKYRQPTFLKLVVEDC